MYRSTDVYGGEDREDVCLQECNQHLESGEEDQHEHRQYAEGYENFVARLEKRLGQKCEGDQKNVASSR